MPDRKNEGAEQDRLIELQMSVAGKSRVIDIIMIVTVMMIFFGFGAATLIKQPTAFSQQENRVLQQFPSISSKYSGNVLDRIAKGKFLDHLFDGSFTAGVSAFYADQFPARDTFVGIKGMAEIAMFKGQNDNVVLGSDGYLIPREDYPDLAMLQKNVGAVDNFAKEMKAEGVPFTMAVTGRPVDMLAKYLPAGFPTDLSDNYWNFFESLTAGKPELGFLNLKDSLKTKIDSGSYGQLYYKTDHHWTTLGAYYAYADIMKVMGGTPQPLSAFTPETVSDAFYGTSWSSAGMKWVKPDQMQYFRYPGDTDYTTAIKDTGESFSGFYDRSYLNVKDKYSSFIGGNNARVDITKNSTDGQPRQKLLVIKDSYAHSVVPFLAYHYDLVIVDMRYFQGSVAKLVKDEHIDRVLTLNYIASFTASSAYDLLNYGLPK